MRQAAPLPVQNKYKQETTTMSSNTKAFEEKMKSTVEHLNRELLRFAQAVQTPPFWTR